jgi:hypothetical protein
MRKTSLKQKCLILCCGIVMAAAGLGPTGGTSGDVSQSFFPDITMKHFSCPGSAKVGSVQMAFYKATTEITSSTQCLLRCFYHGGDQPTKVLYYNLALTSNTCMAQSNGATYF